MPRDNPEGWRASNIWWPPQLFADAKHAAIDASISFSEFVRKAVQEKLEAQVVKCPHCRVNPDVEPHLAICPFSKSAKAPNQTTK